MIVGRPGTRGALCDAVEALFTTVTGSWDGAGVWTNAHLRIALQRDDMPFASTWRQLERKGQLSTYVSGALRTLAQRGTIVVVTNRIAAPGGNTAHGRVWKLAE